MPTVASRSPENPREWARAGSIRLADHQGRPRFVTRGGRQVTIIGGDQARKLSAGLDAAVARGDDDAAQQLLARVTGNYKRGNERAPLRGRPHPG